ncbi:hypothetical protein SAMN05414139_10086 [Burkholderia sp. D7]|nr:hypothetical protein SAMN05414139_10086 [Burkholderia sp. D7]
MSPIKKSPSPTRRCFQSEANAALMLRGQCARRRISIVGATTALPLVVVAAVRVRVIGSRPEGRA